MWILIWTLWISPTKAIRRIEIGSPYNSFKDCQKEGNKKIALYKTVKILLSFNDI